MGEIGGEMGIVTQDLGAASEIWGESFDYFLLFFLSLSIGLDRNTSCVISGARLW